MLLGFRAQETVRTSGPVCPRGHPALTMDGEMPYHTPHPNPRAEPTARHPQPPPQATQPFLGGVRWGGISAEKPQAREGLDCHRIRPQLPPSSLQTHPMQHGPTNSLLQSASPSPWESESRVPGCWEVGAPSAVGQVEGITTTRSWLWLGGASGRSTTGAEPRVASAGGGTGRSHLRRQLSR